MKINWKKIQVLEALQVKEKFDDASHVWESMNQVEKAVYRLRRLRRFVVPEDMRNISPLAYLDYLDRRRAQLIADKSLSEHELLFSLKVLNWKGRTAKRCCSIIRENYIAIETSR